VDGTCLFLNQDMERAQLLSFCGGSAAVFTRRAPGAEGANQDSAALIPIDRESGVLVIADGAGGMRGGAQASSTAVLELLGVLEESVREKSVLREAILDGIEGANREVQALGIGAATTLAVAEIHQGFVRPYHVGDSQILLLGGGGRKKLFTVSHSPTGYALESGLLPEKEAMVHESRHVVFNMIGAPYLHIDMGTRIELSPKDTLVIACDGLFDNLTSDEVFESLRAGTLLEAVQALVERCLARMQSPRPGQPSKPDDLTLIAFRLEGEVPAIA
jgi:serine/threonine protein phosphatase PrpC